MYILPGLACRIGIQNDIQHAILGRGMVGEGWMTYNKLNLRVLPGLSILFFTVQYQQALAHWLTRRRPLHIETMLQEKSQEISIHYSNHCKLQLVLIKFILLYYIKATVSWDFNFCFVLKAKLVPYFFDEHWYFEYFYLAQLPVILFYSNVLKLHGTYK